MRFVFPEHRWFVCALIIMYPLYYFINDKFNSVNNYIKCSLVLLALYVFIYCVFLDTSRYIIESVGFHGIRFSYVFSFFLMITGSLFHSNIDKILYKISQFKGGFLIYLFTFLSLLFYFSFVFLMSKYPCLCPYQFFETIFCITSTIGIFLTVIFNEKFFQNLKCKWFSRFLAIGDYTLEIYLIQFLVIDYIKVHLNKFPINIILVFIVTIALAILFNKLVEMTNKKVMKYI